MPTFSRHDLLDLVVFADPAGPKQTAGRQAELKRTKARMAVVAAGLTPLGHILVLDSWAARATTIEFIDTIYTFWQRWHPSRIGIEQAAQQGLFIEAFDYITRVTKGQTLPIVGIPVPKNQEKDFRIRTTIQPLLSEGRLIVHDSQLDLLSELRNFPRSALRDLIDALAYAISLLPTFRGQAPRPQHETDQYLAYLEASKAPAEVLQRARLQRHTSLDTNRADHLAAKHLVRP